MYRSGSQPFDTQGPLTNCLMDHHCIVIPLYCDPGALWLIMQN